MPNKNYNNGRAKEYRIVKKLKEEGFNIVFRSAGSHSPIDVIAINTKEKVIYAVQSKPSNASQSVINKALEKIGDIEGNYQLIVQVL